MSKVEQFQSMANVKARSDAPNMQVMSSGITAIKKQLDDVQRTLAGYVAAPAAPAPVVAAAPAPAPAPAVAQKQEELDKIIQTVAALTHQVSAIYDAAASQPVEEEEEEEVSDFAEMVPPQVAVVAHQPTFSRTIPMSRKVKPLPVAPAPAKKVLGKAAKVVIAAAPAVEEEEEIAPEETHAAVVRFTETQIKDAHAALDAIIARKFNAESPMDFVVGTEEELYCIRRFRHLMSSRHEELAKNFIRQFDKVCGKK